MIFDEDNCVFAIVFVCICVKVFMCVCVYLCASVFACVSDISPSYIGTILIQKKKFHLCSDVCLFVGLAGWYVSEFHESGICESDRNRIYWIRFRFISSMIRICWYLPQICNSKQPSQKTRRTGCLNFRVPKNLVKDSWLL